MPPAHFLETREPAWNRMEELMAKTRRRGARGLLGSELRELARLYPALAVDVARARMMGLDARTLGRVNSLAMAAHGLLYRCDAHGRLRAIGRFFGHDYPCVFRRLRGHFCLALAVFIVSALGAYATTRLRPAVAYVFVPQGLHVGAEDQEVTAADVGERYRRMPGSLMAGTITTNNIQVAILAFALGIAAGVGTCYVLLTNGMMLGAFFGHFANHGLSYEVWSFLTPHGALEIFAILVSGAAGLRLGLSLAVPGALTRGAALRVGARDAARLLLGTIPMFLLAGLIESFVTPSRLPGAFKIGIGAATLLTTVLYLCLTGRGRGEAPAGGVRSSGPSSSPDTAAPVGA